MELKVGMYVRTLTLSGFGRIAKLIKIDDICITDNGAVDKNQIVKASNNIIDLIEVGDYVNGYPVDYITNLGKEFGKRISFGDETCVVASKFSFDKVYIYEEDIKSIVTKEQFESMSYKL